MKIYKILSNAALVLFAGVFMTSCDAYLDENPDNRAVIDTEEEIISLLGSAYPEAGISVMSELMSDNTDDMSGDPRFLKYDERFYDQVFYWKEVTETDNDGPSITWENGYKAAATANQALQSIEELGGATTTKLKEAKGEALLCRAYAHFWLACMFCQAYDSKNAASDLGLPYATKPETTLYSENIERGTMAELYAKIDKDIQEALPLIGDTHYQQPKFHFNTQAALAFAARFYLFYGQQSQIASARLGRTRELWYHQRYGSPKPGLCQVERQVQLYAHPHILHGWLLVQQLRLGVALLS